MPFPVEVTLGDLSLLNAHLKTQNILKRTESKFNGVLGLAYSGWWVVCVTGAKGWLSQGRAWRSYLRGWNPASFLL